jgi:hypothetical protein
VQAYEAAHEHHTPLDFRAVITLVRLTFEEIVKGNQRQRTLSQVETSPDNRRPRAVRPEG